MDYLSSCWKLTFDPSGASPLIILDYGQKIDQELAWALTKSCEVIEPVDSTTAFIRDGLTRSFALTVKTYTDATLDVDARTAAMNSLITVAALSKKPLRIELQGLAGHYWQFSSAFVKTHNPLREITSGKARWSRTWNLFATGLSYT